MSKQLALQINEQENGPSIGLMLELESFKKENIPEMVKPLIELVREGHVDPLKMLINLKKGIEILSTAESEVRSIAESSITISKGERLDKFYAQIEQAETGVKYDYSTCQDSEWNELSLKSKEIEDLRKKRETFLKSLTKSMADPDTGEVIHPPVRSGKLGLKITLK